MKTKHNKKRNTAFVFEALVREATVAILKNDGETRDKATKLIRKHFKVGSVLKKDLDCYRSLYENQQLDRFTAEKILKEVKIQKHILDQQGLFRQQSDLIRDVNKELNLSVFGNFVPNYKTLATIAQIFSSRISPKNQIILENEIVKNMMESLEIIEEQEKIDKVIYNTFAKKFNKKYETALLDEQRELLTHYISSFADNALGLKVFLNEELARLKIKLEEAKDVAEVKSDPEMIEKTNNVIEKLDSFATTLIDDNILLTIMKTQALVKEIHSDVSND